MRAVRTWKRDGSQNVMSLDAAVANLKQHVLYEERERIKKLGFDAGYTWFPDAIKYALMTGHEISTRHATFRRAGGGWAKAAPRPEEPACSVN